MVEQILERLQRIEEKIDKKIFTYPQEGFTRKCDSLGRITLPIAARRALKIEDNTTLKVSIFGDRVVISKVEN